MSKKIIESPEKPDLEDIVPKEIAEYIREKCAMQ